MVDGFGRTIGFLGVAVGVDFGVPEFRVTYFDMFEMARRWLQRLYL